MPTSSTSAAIGKSYAVIVAMRTPSAWSFAMSRTDRRRTCSVWALMRSPYVSGPVCALPRAFVQQPHDAVQQAVRDLALGQQRQVVAGAIRPEDHDPVRVGPEARARLADVVGHEQIGAFAAELLRGAVER